MRGKILYIYIMGEGGSRSSSFLVDLCSGVEGWSGSRTMKILDQHARSN
jgi:hypothetical protein